MRKLPTASRTRELGLVAYRTISEVVAKAAFFAITVIAARRLSTDGFGIFALGTTVGWLAAVACDFGLQMHVARTVAAAPAAARRQLQRWLPWRLASTAAALALVAAGVAVLSPPPHARALLLFVAAYLAAGVVEFFHYFFRGLSRTDLESTVTLGHRLAMLAAAALVLWLRPDAAWLAAAMLLSSAAAAIYSARLAHRLAADLSAPPDAAPPPRRVEFVRAAAPIGTGILLSALYFRVDLLLLEAWQGTAVVGLYNAAFRLIDALRLFPAALLAVAFPALVRAPGLGSLAQLSTALLLFGAAVAAAAWTLGGWLVPALYGPAYAPAVPAFRILALAFPLMALNYALTHQLIGWDGHRAYAALCLAALIFNVALNSQLIPRLSLAGAAWTTLATEAVLTAGTAAALAVAARSRTRPAREPAMAAT